MKTIYNIRNLSFRYGKELILNNLNFSIYANEIITFVGPNGGGKTTLIKLLLGLLSPQEGEIFFQGKPLNTNLKEESNIGYVPQLATESSINKKILLTTQDILYMAYKGDKKLRQDKIKNLLEVLKIHNLKKKLFNSLSGGQQQRILIARALLNTPDVLILDEPATGIDSNSEFLLYNFLKALRKNTNTTIILITHDLDIVPSISDRVGCLNKDLFIHDKVENFLQCPVFEGEFEEGLELLVHGQGIPHRLLHKEGKQ